MDKIELTRFEKECQGVLRRVQDWLAPGRRSRAAGDYYELMRSIHTAKSHLDYRENGCPMGEHWTDCTCEEGKAGETYQTVKNRLNKMREMRIRNRIGKGSK